MDSKSLISSEFPVLSLEDSGEKALRLMSEYRVFHLPLIQRDNYIALVSEDDILDWDTPEEPLSLAEFLTFRPAVFEGSHPYEAVKIAKEFNLSVLPVVNKNNHFSGVITIDGLFNYLTDNNAIKNVGSIIVLELEQRNYSLSEISRICESNEISILSLSIKNRDEHGLIWVTIKVNTNDIQALVATFERFSYNIIEMYSTDFTKEDVQQNYDMLMHYINI
ncbi:MAG TPA: CBS domain-containing protein [Chitinophagaceae bacterium]|nr:CBS domain-containing protein [Chitinophagaceae bacterium]